METLGEGNEGVQIVSNLNEIVQWQGHGDSGQLAGAKRRRGLP